MSGLPVTDLVLIVDFGGQFTQLIARRVREANVYSEIVPYTAAEKALAELKPKAIILSGGRRAFWKRTCRRFRRRSSRRACRCWAFATASRAW